jgi:hypothetical protein
MDPEHIEAYVDAAAAALCLPLAPAHRPGVIAYFTLAAALAELVAGMPLDVGDDAAPVFAPIAPDQLREPDRGMHEGRRAPRRSRRRDRRCHATMPIGVQIVAAPWREDLALRVAHHLQQAGVVHAPVAALTASR